MRLRHLGPHSFLSPQPHPRQHEWLTQFTPRERHELVAEDQQARNTVFGIILGAICFGLAMLVAVLLLAM